MGRRASTDNVWAARLGVFAAVCLLCSRPARVEGQHDAQHVVVHLDRCTRVDPSQFRRMFDIELTPLIENDSGEDAASYTTTTVWLDCVPGGIHLYLVDDATGRTMVRVVNMAHVADGARGRLLVLLVTELVVASWLELRPFRSRSTDARDTPTSRETERSLPPPEPAQPEVVQPETKRPAAPQPAGDPWHSAPSNRLQPSQPILATENKSSGEALAEPSDAGAANDVLAGEVEGAGIRHWRLGVGLEARRFVSIANTSLGGEVSGAYRPWRAFEVCLGARLSHTSFEGSLLEQQTLRIALTMISASLAAQLVHTANDFELNAGAGVRSGVALLKLTATSAVTPQQAGAQPWLAPIVVFGGAYRMVADLHLRANLELGAMAGVDIAVVENPGTQSARQQSVAAVRGWFGAVTLGLDWIF